MLSLIGVYPNVHLLQSLFNVKKKEERNNPCTLPEICSGNYTEQYKQVGLRPADISGLLS